jgi:hypothetical protein
MMASVLLSAGSASAATVALGARTFDQACNAESNGDVVTVPAGSYSAQSVTCTHSVTLQATGAATVASLTVSGSSGPTFDGFKIAAGTTVMTSSNVSVINATFNDLVYVEGGVDLLFDNDTWEPASGGTAWDNGDMLDFYEQTRTAQANTRITVSDSVFHGLRAPTVSSHSDAIQFCNCDGVAGDAKHAVDVKILRTKFYDNECMNIRANPDTGLTLENDVLGDTISGISGCGYYAFDPSWADVTARYNVFPGTQQIQGAASPQTGVVSTYVGNAYNGFSNGCSGGGATVTWSHNVTTDSTCGGSDVHVSSLGVNSSTGVPNAGSPLIDAGDTASYPATDFTGTARYIGSAPDAGAFETAPPPDTTPPDTSITSTAIGTTASTSAAFTFTGTDNVAVTGYECKLDAGSYAGCTSPKSYSSLATGSHTFSVRAKDAAANVDASPATETWTVTATTVILGNQTVETTLDTNVAGAIEAWPFNASATATAATVKVYLDATSTAPDLKVGIYSNGSSKPGSLLASGSVSSPGAGGWVTVPLGTTTSLTSGVKYWIGIMSTGSGIKFRDHALGGSCTGHASGSGLTAPPSTWGTDFYTGTDCPGSVYVTT